ncbi:MAG: hypothetical protein HND50_05730 [Calditrichaeota bacterium]|nr:hypothetical protein [Calditrichota bacterium]
MSQKIEDNYFNFDVSLKPNQLNKLLVYAKDKYNRTSDTVITHIIHDDIAPSIEHSSIIEDSISYKVLKPISVKFSEPILNYDFHISGQSHAYVDLNPQFSGDSALLTMSYNNLSVGKKWWLDVSVSDIAGNLYETKIYFKTYYKEIVFDFGIIYAFFEDNSPKLYLLRKDPNQITVMDTEKWEILKNIDLSYEPRHADFNPYNGYLYIASFTGSRISVIDPESGHELKHIDPMTVGHSISPCYKPSRITFLSNGVAILKTSYSSSPYAYPFLDSKNNDKLYLHPKFSTPIDAFNTASPYSFNKRKNAVITGRPYYVYNSETNQFKTILEGEESYGEIAVDKNSEKFVTWVYKKDGYIIDSNGDINSYTDKIFRGGFNSFSHRENEEDIVYYLNRNSSAYDLGVVDLSDNTYISKDLRFYHNNWGVSSFLTTPNGKYTLILQGSRIIVVEPKTFRERI